MACDIYYGSTRVLSLHILVSAKKNPAANPIVPAIILDLQRSSSTSSAYISQTDYRKLKILQAPSAKFCIHSSK
jgi:hypothetical protein